MAIRDWIGGFLERHKARYNPHDWPAEGNTEEQAEFLKGWVTAFALGRICEEEANVASARLSSAPPNWRREHIPMIVDAVKQIRAEKSPASHAGGTIEAAKLSSRGCEYCGGEGLAAVYHSYPDMRKGIPPYAAAYCICVLGRHIKKNHAESNPEFLTRIVDLDYVLSGASIYAIEDPAYLKASPRRDAGEDAA